MMGGFKNDGKKLAEYVYDFAVDGGAQGTFALHAKNNKSVLRVGAIVTAVMMKVIDAFTSGGSATLIYGNGDTADGYSGSTIAVASLVDNFIVNGWDVAASLIWDDTNDHPIYVNVADAADGQLIATIATADMTAGKAIFLIEYYEPSLS